MTWALFAAYENGLGIIFDTCEGWRFGTIGARNDFFISMIFLKVNLHINFVFLSTSIIDKMC